MDNKDMRVFLETFGCQMNILDSELIEGQLKAAGHRLVNSPEEANVVLLNTCSVRELSEHKVISRLGKIKVRKDNGEKVVLGVLGCMAERAHEELIKKRPFIDVLIGPSKIHETKALVESAFYQQERQGLTSSLSYFVKRKGLEEPPSMSPLDDLEALDKQRQLSDRTTPWQAYVRITRGCNKFCSFCVVPRTRGPELHRPFDSIIDEVRNLADNGALEVTLLGQTINHYFYEAPERRWSFADLLRGIHEQVPKLKRLRFLTSYPRDFSDEALDVMSQSPRICKYLHIPAQSGSDRILGLMNRGYDVATYMSLIERARTRMPNISFLGDMIVGFPGETEDDFEQSLDLLRKVRFKNLFIFKYSPRPNTVAEKRFKVEVPMSVKKERHGRMLALQNEIAHSLNLSLVGKSLSILCEGPAKLDPATANGLVQLGGFKNSNMRLIGRTEGDHIVHFNGPASLIGSLAEVRISSASPLSLSGELL
jgi:tRNA-2-methylthio-N6-dimethylallyladenosine synthase